MAVAQDLYVYYLSVIQLKYMSYCKMFLTITIHCSIAAPFYCCTHLGALQEYEA